MENDLGNMKSLLYYCHKCAIDRPGSVTMFELTHNHKRQPIPKTTLK